MRIFIAVLILIFSFQSFAKADDISDFEIEGISVGDSLLEFFSEDEIKKATAQSGSYYKDNKYVAIILNKSTQKYDGIEVAYIPDDKKFLIHSLSGNIDFPNNYEGCKKYKSNVVEDIKDLYKNAYTYDEEAPHEYDKFSTVNETTFYPEYGGYVRISCTEWSEEMYNKYGWVDGLDVTIGSDKFKNFLMNEAYN